MATYTRMNAWNNGGTFANTDLLWYAKGVGTMQGRKLDDPSSWWFFAAIHGEYVKDSAFPGWGFLPAPPPVPTAPQPSKSVWDKFWDQCQHQSWYFPPWHRGYLIALEAHIRASVIKLGGPKTWALPYWNYFGPGNEFNIPPAFTQKILPDGSPNPLYIAARYGPQGNGNIYIPIPPVNQDCMSNDVYTGSSIRTKPPGFGGPATGFSHSGRTSGNLENNPHNLVHVYVGGSLPNGTYGLMSDPGLAALDPIFYLHHANIDRMWAVWNLADANPNDPKWLNGPAASGGREFVMPMPDGKSWVYIPKQMNSLSQLDYTYDSLPKPVVASAANLLADRLTRLGATAAAAKVKEGAAVTEEAKMELVGASQQALPIKGTGSSTSVKLDAGVRRKVAASLTNASETAPPDRVYLNLENVRGTHDASVLSVYINLPDGANPSDHPELLAGSVGLFGLRRASLQDGQHAGEGLDFVLDITKIVDALHLNHTLDADSLQVRIVPHQAVPEQAEITVGRISIYRQGS
jgi:tyrosinase